MIIKVNIHFIDPRGGSPDLPAYSVVHGNEVPYSRLNLGDLTHRIAETEAHLSRITGMVVKIETGAE